MRKGQVGFLFFFSFVITSAEVINMFISRSISKNTSSCRFDSWVHFAVIRGYIFTFRK